MTGFTAMLHRLSSLSIVALALPLATCDKLPPASPPACAAEQAVVDGLTRKAQSRAETGRLPGLRTAHALLHDIADARARLRACEAGPAEPAGRTDPPVGAGSDSPEDLRLGDPPPVDADSYAISPPLHPHGEPIRVKFLDGEADGQQWVADRANLWTRCNGTSLRFEFFDAADKPLTGNLAAPPSYDIRVTFTGSIYQSAIGPDPSPDSNRPSMYLGGLDRPHTDEAFRQRTVLHEFGHALGLLHEHRRKEMTACIDRDKAIAYYKRTNNWSPADTEEQVLTPLPDDTDTSSTYDTRSVMNYIFPAELLKDGCTPPQPALEPSPVDCEAVAFYYRAEPPLEGTQGGETPFKTEFQAAPMRGDRAYYRWTVQPKSTKNIASIRYDMRPYFGVVEVGADQKFAVKRETWGTFPIEIEVRYTNNQKPRRYTYVPDLGGAPPKKGQERQQP